MTSFVRRLINDTAERDSEDVVQEVMLGIWDAADVTLPLDRLSSYVYRSLRNKVIDIIRGRKNNISFDAPAGDKNGSETIGSLLPDLRYDAAGDLEKAEIREMLFDAIDSLKKSDREIIVLTEFENRSYDECSRILGEPVGTLLSRKSRAMKKVRNILNEIDFDMGD